MPLLFSYGTLQQKEVQLANFGRELSGSKDTLQGYVVGEIEITDERVLRESGKAIHPILRFTGNAHDEVAGTVFEITDSELAQADDYEVDDYVRISARLKSGKTAWIYAAANKSSFVSEKFAYAAALVGGAVLWSITSELSGKTEAWDSSLYWMAAYPLAIVLAACLGYFVPEKPWRWGLAVMLVQAVVLVVSGSDFSLLPLGLILFSVLALPAIGAAALMARFRLRLRKL